MAKILLITSIILIVSLAIAVFSISNLIKPNSELKLQREKVNEAMKNLIDVCMSAGTHKEIDICTSSFSEIQKRCKDPEYNIESCNDPRLTTYGSTSGTSILHTQNQSQDCGEAESLSGRFVEPMRKDYEIEFPPGWTGCYFGISMISPHGLHEGTAQTYFVILSADKTKVDDAIASNSDIFRTAITKTTYDCRNQSQSNSKLNGYDIIVLEQECYYKDGFEKSRSYVIAREDKPYLVAAFRSNSTSVYNLYLPSFEQSVATLRVYN